jgi:hypothetical protein
MNEELVRQTQALEPFFGSLRKKALIVGLVFGGLAIVGYLQDHEQFFRSYLLGFVYWTGLSLGCLALLMMHHLAGGRWGFAIRRLLEAGTRTLGLMFVLSLPVILLGMHELYEWTHEDVVAADPILTQKASFLNTPFFTIRTVIYFAVWGVLAFLLSRWSAHQDTITETYPTRRLQVLSGPGAVALILTASLFVIDWIMSLEPHWFSTIFPAIFILGQMLLAWAFMVLIAVPLSRRPPLDGLLTNERLRDLGTFMLAFVMLWAYTSFSQLIIIWGANLPEEITWYFTRLQGGWQNVGYMLIALHFGLPFVLLVSSRIKARLTVLVSVASGIVIMRLVDLFWITAPALHKHSGHNGFTLSWLDIVIPIGIGGLWLFVFFGQVAKRSLVPLNDPRFDYAALVEEGKEHHG